MLEQHFIAILSHLKKKNVTMIYPYIQCTPFMSMASGPDPGYAHRRSMQQNEVHVYCTVHVKSKIIQNKAKMPYNCVSV